MSCDGRETAIELADRIKREADKIQDGANAEIRLEICKLTRQLKKKLAGISEQIGRGNP